MLQSFPLSSIRGCRRSEAAREVEYQGPEEKLLESSEISRDQEKETGEAESQALGECATRAEAVR